MNYIKLNDDDKHLSLGNLFNAIKKVSVNTSSAIQSELFCSIFLIESISDTTVGNYATGYRAIANQYKQIYINFKRRYQEDDTILIPVINNIISIISGYISSYKTIKDINKDINIQSLCKILNTYLKNDLDVQPKLKRSMINLFQSKDYYHYLSEILFFVILDKKQPIYETDIINNTIEEILMNTGLSVNALRDYLSIEFREGISYIPSLKKLANNNNPYALHELGNLEYFGRIKGYPRYKEAFDYYYKAASFDHPTSCAMIGHMIINKKIGSLNKDDIMMMHKYLDKAISLKSISAYNTKGLTYLRGINLDNKAYKDKAIEYFKKAANLGYVYAYNNLGKILEDNGKIDEAIKYYEKSALEEESWACNKMGLYYLDKDSSKAYDYFKLGSEANIDSLCPWNIYNLVKYFYMVGSASLGIDKDLDKSLDLLNEIRCFEPSYELFLDIYYELYLKDKKYFDMVQKYLDLINDNYSLEKKKEIQESLNNLLNKVSIDI